MSKQWKLVLMDMKHLRKPIVAVVVVCLVLMAVWLASRRPGIEAPPPAPSQPTEPGGRADPPPPVEHRFPQAGTYSKSPVDAPPKVTRPPENTNTWPSEDDDAADSLVPPSDLLDILVLHNLPQNAKMYAEKRTVAGHTVSHARVRFANEDGSLAEIEVVDMGGGSPVQLLTALGFNPMQRDEATDSGFRLTMDFDGRLGNWEYDHEATTGMLQIVVGKRFLLKVSLEEVEAEAFRAFFQDALPIAELEEAAVRIQDLTFRRK